MSASRKGKALLELWLNFYSAREPKEEEEGSFTLKSPGLDGFHRLSLSNPFIL